MDEHWKYHVKWNKPDAKDHILYDSIYIKYLEEVNLQRQKVDSWLPRAANGWEWTANGHRDISGVM